MYGFDGFYISNIWVSLLLLITLVGNGCLQSSHSNLAKLYEATTPLISFLTLLFIHIFKQSTCTTSHEPLHLHGEINTF